MRSDVQPDPCSRNSVLTPEGLSKYRFDPKIQYVVRYLNPSANKPLHVGHLRSAVIGSAIHAILRAGGAKAIRHCLIEDAGRFMFEGLAGFSRLGVYPIPESLRAKGDHVVGWCFQNFRQTEGKGQDEEAELPGRPDFADELNRRSLEGDERVQSLWRQVKTLALLGQQETLQRLHIGFDYCDFESTADAYLPALLREATTAGIFERRSNGEVYYQPESSPSVDLIDRFDFPLENLYLLTFLRRLYSSNAWIKGRVNIVLAGNEWREEISQYGSILRKLGIQHGPEIYIPVFTGMVTMGGRKVASRTGHGVLADDLLDLVRHSVWARSFDRIGEPGASLIDSAVTVIIVCFFLSHPWTADLEFSADAVLDEQANPGWSIARCWAALQHGDGKRTAERVDDQRCEQVIAKARSKLSFEEPVMLLQSLCAKWLCCPGWRTADHERTVRFLLRALGLVPAKTDRRPFEVGSLLEAEGDFASRSN